MTPSIKQRSSSSDDAVWRTVEAWRENECQARQPLLARFRATPEELELRAREGPISTITLNQAVTTGCIKEFGESLAALGSEGLRFSRWIDALPTSETEVYLKCRRRLP